MSEQSLSRQSDCNGYEHPDGGGSRQARATGAHPLSRRPAPAENPYYQHAGITIYHGDCRDVAPLLSADVMITDPPYGIGLRTKTSDYRGSAWFDRGESLRSSLIYDDRPDMVRELIKTAIPTLLDCVPRALIFCGPAMLYAYPEPRAIGTVFTPNGAGRSAWGFQCSHPILYYGCDPYLTDQRGGRPNGFRDEQPNPEKFDHPCPKPLKWMHWAIARASRPGEIVLDPFMGTGTTLRAAKNLGRRAVGIEIEERYCEIAVQRLAQEVLDLDRAS
jgi:site-specific DNA-methyltransferase (adenine-specific)